MTSAKTIFFPKWQQLQALLQAKASQPLLPAIGHHAPLSAVPYERIRSCLVSTLLMQ